MQTWSTFRSSALVCVASGASSCVASRSEVGHEALRRRTRRLAQAAAPGQLAEDLAQTGGASRAGGVVLPRVSRRARCRGDRAAPADALAAPVSPRQLPLPQDHRRLRLYLPVVRAPR